MSMSKVEIANQIRSAIASVIKRPEFQKWLKTEKMGEGLRKPSHMPTGSLLLIAVTSSSVHIASTFAKRRNSHE
jgi:hypothetical protein